jgi:hypothetical protein
MPILRYEAILTHIIYGTRRVPAHPETLKEVIIVANIRNHKMIIVITPPPFDFRPKKMIDQRAFKTSCIQKRIKVSKTPSLGNPFCQTKKMDSPMRKYRALQIGPNTLSGGVYFGFFNSGYHVGIDLIVKILPIPPAAKQAKTLIISFTMLSFMAYLPCFPAIITLLTNTHISKMCLTNNVLKNRSLNG